MISRSQLRPERPQVRWLPQVLLHPHLNPHLDLANQRKGLKCGFIGESSGLLSSTTKLAMGFFPGALEVCKPCEWL